MTISTAVDDRHDGRSEPARPRLTEREMTVLGLIAQGLTAAAIGRRLGISARTVHRHLGNLYRKLNASDRLVAVLRAQAMGLLDRDPPEV